MTSADPEDRKREESALRGFDLGQRLRICFVAVVATSCIFEKFSQKLGPPLNSSCPIAKPHRASGDRARLIFLATLHIAH